MSKQTNEETQNCAESSKLESNPLDETSESQNVKNDASTGVASTNDTSTNVVRRHDFLFKLILLGDTQSGKTNLLSR